MKSKTVHVILKIIQWAGGAVLACVIAFSFYARFAHPELTTTQLFLQYWELWAMAAVSGFASMWAEYAQQ